MKKVFTIFLLVIYSFSSAGATVYQHFCMGRLIETAVHSVFAKKDACIHCGMNTHLVDNNCCKEKPTQVKLKSAHQKTTVTEQIKLFPLPAIDHLFDRTISDLPAIKNNCAGADMPPGRTESIPLFISNAVFRI